MTQYDKQRIENAIWTLLRYSDELDDTGVDIMIDGVYVNTNDALRVLEDVLYHITK